MSNESGPWARPPSPKAPPARGRPGLWLLLAAGVGGLLFALMRAFPGAVNRPEQWANVAYMGGFLVLVATGLFRAGRARPTEHLRNAAIWIAIIAVLALGAAYRDELAGVGQRLSLAFSGGDPVATGDHELAIPQDDQGAFIVIGELNGQRIRFMVDTGATETVLSPDDARRAGVDIGKLNFDYEAETANGTGYGAAYTADRLEVGPIALDNFRMAINKAPMSTSLLGRSFLNRLESYEVRGRRLILRWKDTTSG